MFVYVYIYIYIYYIYIMHIYIYIMCSISVCPIWLRVCVKMQMICVVDGYECRSAWEKVFSTHEWLVKSGLSPLSWCGSYSLHPINSIKRRMEHRIAISTRKFIFQTNLSAFSGAYVMRTNNLWPKGMFSGTSKMWFETFLHTTCHQGALIVSKAAIWPSPLRRTQRPAAYPHLGVWKWNMEYAPICGIPSLMGHLHGIRIGSYDRHHTGLTWGYTAYPRLRPSKWWQKTYATSKSRATLYSRQNHWILGVKAPESGSLFAMCLKSDMLIHVCIYIYIHIQLYKIHGGFQRWGSPRSCILMQFSIRHHPLWGTPIKVCLPPCHWQLPIKWNLHILGHRGRQTLAIQVDSSHWMKLCLSESGNKRCVDYSTFWSSFTQIPISNHSFALIPRVQKWPCSN